jgi:hypothetical protein
MKLSLLKPEGIRRVGIPKVRWRESGEDNLKNMGAWGTGDVSRRTENRRGQHWKGLSFTTDCTARRRNETPQASYSVVLIMRTRHLQNINHQLYAWKSPLRVNKIRELSADMVSGTIIYIIHENSSIAWWNFYGKWLGRSVLLLDKYRLKVLQLWRDDTRKGIYPFVKETEARAWHRPIGDPDLWCTY